jgi:hypothetical protein
VNDVKPCGLSPSPVGFLTPRPSDPNIVWASSLPFPIAACILSMDGRVQISAYFRKERIIAKPRYGRVSEKIGGRALANDDSMRFGTATRARTSVEVEAEEGLGASRGRRENLQKLSALTSSE